MTQTAVWPWPERTYGVTKVTLGENELAFIRGLTVMWNSAEHGAAGLADADFYELEDSPDETLSLVEMFLSTAKIDSWAGQVRNPFGAIPDDASYWFDHVPDSDIAARLRSGEDIAFKPDADLIRLWKSADLRGTGIDPKRPFGSGHVSRDVRALIDTDKAMKPKAFRARMKHLEAQMLLMLLRFVQNAELPLGDYARGSDGRWVPADMLETGAGAEITHEEWVQRLYPGQIYQTRDYVKTLRAAAHLMWEGRLSGEYRTVSESLALGNAYGVPERTYSEVSTDEAARVGLSAFQEEELKPLTRIMVRILNSQSRFDEALKVLETSDALPDAVFDQRDGITPSFVLQAEATLARIGQRVLADGVYIDAMESFPKLPGMSWRWLYDILYADPRAQEGTQPHLVQHMQAIAAQIRFMRGPFVPRPS